MLNKNINDTDEKKVICALSYMTEGVATTWAQNFYTQAFSTASTLVVETFNAFWINFEKAFLPFDLSINVITKLKSLRQETDLAKYISKFKTLITQANIKEDISIIHFFENRLREKLREKIYLKEEVPKTFNKAVIAAVQLNANWIQGKTISKGQHQRKTYKPSGNHRFTSIETLMQWTSIGLGPV